MDDDAKAGISEDRVKQMVALAVSAAAITATVLVWMFTNVPNKGDVLAFEARISRIRSYIDQQDSLIRDEARSSKNEVITRIDDLDKKITAQNIEQERVNREILMRLPRINAQR